MLKNELFMRQKQLICELTKIFPIQRLELGNRVTTSTQTSQMQKLKILNSTIRLWPTSTTPAVTSLPSESSSSSSSNHDRENAIAMGHICQCVHMLAIILGVPLRYPVVYRASKSYVVESVSGGGVGENSKGAETTPRMLALFRQASSTQEELFLYAVSLLNADLVQIRVLFDSASHRSVDHSDLLINLKWIFDFFNKS